MTAAMPGFGAEPTVAAQQARLVERVLAFCERVVEGLTVEQLCDTRGERTSSIGFDVWHVARTADNIIHFAFERERPVWLTGGYDEAWGLPRVEQGTNMTAAAAYALRFPAAAELARYAGAVREAIVPRIAGMSGEYLAGIVFIRPWGEVPRMEAIGHGLIGHGNGHLGRASYARTLLGKDGLPY